MTPELPNFKNPEIIHAKDVRPGDVLWWDYMGRTDTVEVTATVDRIDHDRPDHWTIHFTYTSGMKVGKASNVRKTTGRWQTRVLREAK